MGVFVNEQTGRRGRGRPQARPDEETINVILEAAAERFRVDGYAGTSMSAVAFGAGVSTRTLYRLVPSKGELFKRVVGNRIGRFILEAGDPHGGPEDLPADLERLLTAYGRLILEPSTLAIYRLVVSECVRFPEIGQAFYEGAVSRTATYMAEWLERRCQAGQIRLKDSRTAAGMLRGMMVQDPERSVLLTQASPPDAAQIAERARECARLFLEGCIAR